MDLESRGRDTLASDHEREVAVGGLRDACAEGRLTFDELSQRVERALAARTRSEIDLLTADLPAPAEAGRKVKRRKPRRWLIGIIGESRLRGRWRMEGSISVVGLIGEWTIDLRDAEIEGDEIVINAFCLIGELTVLVPPGTDVVLTGLTLIGERHEDRTQALPGMPRVVVRAYSLIGGVYVRIPQP